MTWTEFLRCQAAVACDFFTVDTAALRCYYLLFFIQVETRRVIFAWLTTNPTGAPGPPKQPATCSSATPKNSTEPALCFAIAAASS